jgi:histidine triad (HIT) family protein
MPSTAATCPFCEGLEPAIVVAEDPLAIAAISRRPINRHHVLVIPRRHVERFSALTVLELAAITRLAQRISAGMTNAIRPDAITLVSDDDLTRSGYTLVAHWKLHVIPRFNGEAIQIDWAREDDPGLQVRAEYCSTLRSALGR